MAEPLRVLLVEDSEDDAALLLRELQRGGYEPLSRRVETAADMQAALEGQEWDIIISDYTMPQFSGLAALELCQAQELDLPFILVSGTVGEEDTVAAMKAGAHDYLLKGNLIRLVPAIRRELREAEGRRERRRAEAALREADRRAIRQYEQLLERLAGLAQDFGAAPDLPAACRALHRFVEASAPCNGLFISLYDPERQLRTCIYSAGDKEEDDVSELPPLPLSDSPQSRAIQSGEIVVVDDFQAAVAGRPVVTWGIEKESCLPQSSVAVPMSVTGRVIGAFEAQSVEPAAYGREHVTALRMAANLAAVAIENARLLQRTQEQARQVQRIINTVPEGVLLLDVGQRVLLANPAAVEHLLLLAGAGVGDVLAHLGGRPAAEMLGLAPDSAPWRWHEVALPAAQRIFEVAAQPVTTEARAEGWVVVLREVTEERRLQEHLQTQDRLATVGQLAAGIAHDFNNVMAVITLYSGTLAKDPNHTKRDHYLATISDQARHAANLIGQILDFSRASVMERSRLDLLPFVKEVVKLLKRTLPESIVVELAAGEEECPVEADPTRLQQVLMNLAVNARDAMPEGGKLRMTLWRLTLKPGHRPPLPAMAAGRWACLAVADTGSGIPDDVLPHIFEPFFTTKQPGQGTGLGLAQVYGIVKQHGGEIGVESRVDRGTIFTVYLPLPGETAQAAVEMPDQLPSPLARGRETILLVEDDRATREAIQEVLETLGYRVMAAGSGREALTLFDRHEEVIDLVVSDMVMPEMSGVEFYQALDARQPGVKVMVATGYPLADEGRHLLERGVVAWIQKPFSADELAHKVREALGGSGT
ncbi:MAG: response regulator [Chloroflexi bacterium]|nr:response regulator [Chloroflexota bacterium]